jgi:PhoH-like ATPase
MFVLDTNVLMHDPGAIYSFEEHDLYLPMVVLEEMDRGKKGMSEVSRNVRAVSRNLDELMSGTNASNIGAGVPIRNHMKSRVYGRLFFQTNHVDISPPSIIREQTADNMILAVTLAVTKEYPDHDVTLVSKDINLRIKATVLGIHTEDYRNDQVIRDIDLLHNGMLELPLDFWETHSKDVETWNQEGHTYYRISGPSVSSWYLGQCVYLEDGSGFEAIVRDRHDTTAIIEVLQDYRLPKHAVWGITARNRAQNFALNLLLDEDIHFVSLMGTAGTGKTLLALASGLSLVFDHNRHREIIMTRITVPMGEDIGFLPGNEEEKMTPWMGALMDNLEFLSTPKKSSEEHDWGRAATDDLLRSRIRVRSMNFMRGRTFLGRFIILDEAQNLTPKQMKSLITRAGHDTKIVCLGNTEQIDTPYLTETTSGITYVVDRFKNEKHIGHITLERGERSYLADLANRVL